MQLFNLQSIYTHNLASMIVHRSSSFILTKKEQNMIPTIMLEHIYYIITRLKPYNNYSMDFAAVKHSLTAANIRITTSLVPHLLV